MSKNTGFPNRADSRGTTFKDQDEFLAAELEAAGIKPEKYEVFRDQHPEVKTAIRGSLGPWFFTRNWYYWSAKGPGIPPDIAEELHKEFGQEVRVEGHCGCPSPLEWCKGFAVGSYHIDTSEGLKALADVIKGIMEKAKVKLEGRDAV